MGDGALGGLGLRPEGAGDPGDVERWGVGDEEACGWSAGEAVSSGRVSALPTNSSLWKVGLTDKTLTTFIALLPLCSSSLRSAGGRGKGEAPRVWGAWLGGWSEGSTLGRGVANPSCLGGGWHPCGNRAQVCWVLKLLSDKKPALLFCLHPCLKCLTSGASLSSPSPTTSALSLEVLPQDLPVPRNWKSGEGGRGCRNRPQGSGGDCGGGRMVGEGVEGREGCHSISWVWGRETWEAAWRRWC